MNLLQNSARYKQTTWTTPNIWGINNACNQLEIIPKEVASKKAEWKNHTKPHTYWKKNYYVQTTFNESKKEQARNQEILNLKFRLKISGTKKSLSN